LLSKNVKIQIYRIMILPVALYGCETWLLTAREEHRLRGFENRALRRLFGPKRDEVAGYWRRLHNKEVYALYSSPSIIRVIKSRRLKSVGVWWRNLREGGHLEDPCVDGRIILKWIFEK
jgi:hypothetical protein